MEKYTLLSEIGLGISSTVHLGINKITKEKVAIKIVKKSKRFESCALNEIGILSHLSEECITSNNHVRYIEYLKVDGHMWLIFEFLAGGDMYDYRSEFMELKWNTKIKVLKNMTQSIAFLHHKGVAHRDIKLENLIIDRGNFKIKVIDFGSSCIVNPQKHLQEKYSNIRSSTTPELFGTLELMSPESLQSYNAANKRSYIISNYLANDIYALGITFFDIFSDANHVYKIYKKGNYEPEILQALKVIDHPILEDIIFNMIRYKPKDRSSIDEVLDRLKQLKET
jgi:serine/threonine protein kinase